MLLPVKWLRDYVEFDIDAKELAEKLTATGSHVESIDDVDKGVKKVVVGKILEIEKHPDADKLVITKIDVGEEEPLQIVTGADNISEEDFVPVAVVGARLPDGMKIKKGKLRGIESFGMLCSADELGISQSVVPKNQKDGIFILKGNYTLGTDIKEELSLIGEVMELEITPNRPDCLSIIGMAREASASLNKVLKYPVINIVKEQGDISELVKGIDVQDSALCPRYYAKVIEDAEVKESPLWMQTRLMEAGVRPINNIVDVTNYVMLEYGQPLHAFDLDTLEGSKIIVRNAKDGETIKTLDESERKLDSSMLVIADENNPVAIAGVMGGFDTEVTSETKTILIESATFDSTSIRRTSKKLNLRSEASTKFEKGLDPMTAEIACRRVCQLIEEMNSGKVVKGEIDKFGKKPEKRIIEVSDKEITKLIGIEIDSKKILSILNHLEIETEYNDGVYTSVVPTFRNDLELKADIIEEIARIYGFDNIGFAPLVGTLTRGEKSELRKLEDLSKDILWGMGLNELMTYSFISPKTYDKILLPTDDDKRNYIKLRNPLGEDYSVMRTTLIGNTMEVLARNYKYGVDSAKTFEIGNTFRPIGKELTADSLPQEKKLLSLGMYGSVDFFTLKGVVEGLLDRLGIENVEYEAETENTTFHPGRTANVIVDGESIGVIGEIHPDVLENYDIRVRCLVGELDFKVLSEKSKLERKYTPLPKYPPMTRDIALTVDESLEVREIEKVILANGKNLVEKVELFDVYTGNQVEDGKKSVAYSIVYRSLDKTLTDEEVVKVHGKILEELENKLEAILRKQD